MLQRPGTARFTGTALEPRGDFEAGRANEIAISFADRQTIVDRWDGRAESKTLEYHAPAAVVSATIDPRRVLLLDLTALNNTKPERVESSPTRWSWTVRWTTWLQDVLLTHAFLF